jgi:hypothetical protein
VGLTIVFVLAACYETLNVTKHRERLAFTTAALDLPAGQLVNSERGVRGGPLAFSSVNPVPKNRLL